MSMKNMFYEAAVKDARKNDQELVDAITEAAPILASMPMQAATGMLSHLYEELTNVDEAASVELDASLPDIGMDTELKQQDLGKIGGKFKVGQDKARRMGGPNTYFQSKIPKIMRATAEAMEQSLFVNNIRNFAIDNSKWINAGASSGDVYTLYCIRWEQDEITGLWSPEGAGTGSDFEVGMINGGNVYEDSNGVLVYGAYVQTYFGLLLANSRYVSTIDNINSSNIPLEAEMDQVILNSRGTNNGRTVIYCHPQVLTWLYKYKGDALQQVNTDVGVNRSIAMWNGIPIVTSYTLAASSTLAS